MSDSCPMSYARPLRLAVVLAGLQVAAAVALYLALSPSMVAS